MRVLTLLVLGFFVVATACSTSSSTPCCSASFDAGSGGGTLCMCPGAVSGGCTLGTMSATSCTITCTGSTTPNGTLMGTPRASCQVDGG